MSPNSQSNACGSVPAENAEQFKIDRTCVGTDLHNDAMAAQFLLPSANWGPCSSKETPVSSGGASNSKPDKSLPASAVMRTSRVRPAGVAKSEVLGPSRHETVQPGSQLWPGRWVAPV